MMHLRTNASTSVTPPSTTEPLHVVLVATTDTTAAEVQVSVSSVHRHIPQASVHLVHFTSTPDPSLNHLVPSYTTISSRRPYDDPLLALPDVVRSSDSSVHQTPTLVLRPGVRLSAHAVPWLLSALRAYSRRPDLAAISLDAIVVKHRRPTSRDPDHVASAWEPLSSSTVSSPAFFYRLLPVANALLVNPNPSLRVWPVFREWLSLRRSDWYRYPVGMGVDNTPLGRAKLPESNWTRAPFNVWFSKFLHEYQLAVAFPTVASTDSAKLAARDAEELMRTAPQTWSFPTKPAVFLGSGARATGSYFGDETIERIVHLAEQNDNTISLTLVNKVFLDTARSWLCNVDTAGFRPAGLVWAVTDEVTRDALSNTKGASTVWLARVTGGKETGNEFGNPGYWKLMLERTMLITEILARGVSVFNFETDAIWLGNPHVSIERLLKEEADIVGTINTREEVSGNFFFLKATLATRRLWHEITAQFEKAYKAEKFELKKADSWTYIQNDQSLLTQLVLRNSTWRALYPLSFMTLDMEKFVDGRWYTPEQGFYTSERARKPVVVNNNFVIGIKEKTVRAKSFGHWFWDEKNKKCVPEAVHKAVKAASTTS